uniref:At1g61320/AtMIF1 LRR domain-containing protein n=1 Tax=Leersia perrieri TaxID=77586 RepID=A0A0D9VB58_9ORYZ
MGFLALQRHLSSMQPRRRRRHRQQTLARTNKSIAPLKKRNDSPFERVDDGDSQHGETLRYSTPYLPEDIWRHIHSLMPMTDAARAACLSRAFLISWRCHPNLTLDWETVCKTAYRGKFRRKIDDILRNHSGTVKILKLHLSDEDYTYPCIDRWLEIAVTPGIEELDLLLYKKYRFPCSLLSDGVRDSIRCLRLECCSFHPMAELGPLRSLTNLYLNSVRITGDELECLITNSLALEQLSLYGCFYIRFLKIPCMLQQLSSLTVRSCWRLKEVVCEAPNLSCVNLFGGMKLSFGESLRMKSLIMFRSNAVCYAHAELPLIMPNLETMILCSFPEVVVNVPMVPTKFLYLKHLTIQIMRGTYDHLFLVYFLDASPSLVTFCLDVSQQDMSQESILESSSHLRQLPEHSHDCLKRVEIIGFNSAKSLIELTCCIINNAVSLEHLIINTLDSRRKCPWEGNDNNLRCLRVSNSLLKESSRALIAVRRFIEGIVAPTTYLTLLGPCTRCHPIPLDDPMLVDSE